jgi:Holliday junction resolvase RusA-like endonuclease
MNDFERLLEFGETTIKINGQPLSNQSSKSEKKKALQEKIHNNIGEFDKYLISDVKVEIIFYCYEETRYENNNTIDIDNIIKPILDAISGKLGIIVDDNQVQTIVCSWLDIHSGDEFFEIKISCFDQQYISKSDIAFVEIKRYLYLPFDKSLCKNAINSLISTYKYQFEQFDKLIELGVARDDARAILPSQRLFHKNRLTDFNELLFTVKELLDPIQQ